MAWQAFHTPYLSCSSALQPGKLHPLKLTSLPRLRLWHTSTLSAYPSISSPTFFTRLPTELKNYSGNTARLIIITFLSLSVSKDSCVLSIQGRMTQSEYLVNVSSLVLVA